MNLPKLGSFGFVNGFWPDAVKLGIGAVLNSIYWGRNVWLRANGWVEIAHDLLLAYNVDTGLVHF